jgi:GNAT superfamily N-acetyltransferase
MFRIATPADLDRIEEIYNELHTAEETGQTFIGWNRQVYPTRSTAAAGIDAGDMIVQEDNGIIVAAARINQDQGPEYLDASWEYPVEDKEVMVMHTLVVSPHYKGRGYGTNFVEYYENYALECGCNHLRIDTNEKNISARTLYNKLGYKEISIVPCNFNGIPGVNLVCLEKLL